jgi:hypothetical protein
MAFEVSIVLAIFVATFECELGLLEPLSRTGVEKMGVGRL